MTDTINRVTLPLSDEDVKKLAQDYKVAVNGDATVKAPEVLTETPEPQQ